VRCGAKRGQYEDVLMYDGIRRIQAEEKRSNALTQLKEDTYSNVFAYLDQLKKGLASKWDTQKVRELENCEKVLQDVERKRVEKLLTAVFNEVYNKLDAPQGLTVQEKILYENARRAVQEFKKMMESMGVPEAETPQKDIINVRLLKDVPRFKATDGNEYGPFTAGDVCSLPNKEGRIMIEKNAAEPLQ